ncbi:MAG TPA: hypothetical protein DCZ92_07300 [Elusimicrobia bacterium]|nr:MAG: hypothetical protein A2016_02705 [Elusimicrobia bacterium GWF2_62_30]HBA60612.1 hypothetical protein [Elusimicrobiota bacterium]
MIETGTIINGHAITGELGRGGMGVVYKAHDKTLKRDAAIKMLLPAQATATNKKRFIREAAAIARCGHPGIIKIYSYGEHDGLPYFAMEFVDGKTLGNYLELARTIKNAGDLEVLRKYGYIQPPAPGDEDLPFFMQPLTASPLGDPDYENHAAGLIAGVADALYEAHSLGILHRDIKPTNILIAKNGLPKLADFGLAKFSGSSDITTGQPMLGTLKYMAPEIFSNAEGGPASDIYALGTVFYELLTLEHPFPADNTAALIKAVTQGGCPPPSKWNKALSPALGLVVMKCLETDPARRYGDARELADAIRLAARPKGLKTQILDGIKGLLQPADRAPAAAAREEKPPQQVQEADLKEAARLLGEARRVYFADFAAPKAHDLLLEALKLDPWSVDLNLMLVVLSYHMGLHSTVRKAAPKMKHLAKAAPDADTRHKAEALSEYLEGSKTWLKKMEKYLGDGHEDPCLLAICARARMNANDYPKAKEYAARINRVIPGAGLFSWFIEAYYTGWTGKHEKSLELTFDAIKRHPKNVMLRYALAQGLLEMGKLDKAEKAMEEAAGLPEQNDFFIFLRAELAIMRKDYKTACIELRKFIGAGQSDSVAYAYYRLSRLYSLRGDRKEALRHLEIGRNLAPEAGFKSNEELTALVQGSVEFRASFEDLPADCLEFNFTQGQQVLLDNLFSARNNAGTASSTVYIFEKDALPRAVRAWMFFNEHQVRGLTQTKMFLPSLPLSSFVDARGNILKTEFIRTQADYGRYLAMINYAAPLQQLALGPIEVQLNMEGLWKERQGGLMDLRLDEPSHLLGHRAHILALPADSEITELSVKPDKEVKRGGWRFLVYSRFFFDGEHFRLTARFKP